MRFLSPDVPQHLRFQIFLLSHFVFGSGKKFMQLQQLIYVFSNIMKFGCTKYLVEKDIV